MIRPRRHARAATIAILYRVTDGSKGVKRGKHGEPDKAKLAKEVQDVLCSTLQVALHYGIELELEASIEDSYQRLKSKGFIE